MEEFHINRIKYGESVIQTLVVVVVGTSVCMVVIYVFGCIEAYSILVVVDEYKCIRGINDNNKNIHVA